MNIYFFNDFQNFDYALFLHLLPVDRQQKALKYKNIVDRKLCVSSFLLLRIALQKEFGLKTPPEIVTNKTGKPYFTGIDNLFFNISHCALGAVCAVSDVEFGIDIQDISDVTEGVKLKVLTSNELKAVNASSDQNRSFTYIWSRKESLLKKNGTGLINGLNTIEALDNKDICTYDGGDFFISVSGAHEIKLINQNAINLQGAYDVIFK